MLLKRIVKKVTRILGNGEFGSGGLILRFLEFYPGDPDKKPDLTVDSWP